MQHQILINVIIFVAYVLNLPLNTQRSHSRSQRAGKGSLILAHDRRPIYRAPTYIAVPLLGPHQPRYIGLTLYWELWVKCLTTVCLISRTMSTSYNSVPDIENREYNVLEQSAWYWKLWVQCLKTVCLILKTVSTMSENSLSDIENRECNVLQQFVW